MCSVQGSGEGEGRGEGCRDTALWRKRVRARRTFAPSLLWCVAVGRSEPRHDACLNVKRWASCAYVLLYAHQRTTLAGVTMRMQKQMQQRGGGESTERETSSMLLAKHKGHLQSENTHVVRPLLNVVLRWQEQREEREVDSTTAQHTRQTRHKEGSKGYVILALPSAIAPTAAQFPYTR